MKDENKSEKIKKKYDPRSGYEFVPAWLMLSMMLAKLLAFLSPFFAAMFLSQEKAGLIMAIPSDDTFNMLLATLVGFFIRENIGKVKEKLGL